MKKHKKSKEFLEELKKIPIIQIACEKVGISRNTVYRWKKDDEEFRKAMGDALIEGESFVNDMSESQVLTLIKEKSWPAISFWLRHHHSAYRDRLELTTVVPQEELTPEQEALVREALRLSATNVDVVDDNNKNNQNEQPIQDDSTGIDGSNDQGPESQDKNN
jgi:hypothetical protein